MELHPDRNFGNIEETTKLFAEVQSAYEVLSDPQERGWYDSHRNAILRDETEPDENHYEHNVRLTSTGDIIRMFNLVGRKDFSDSASGFFATLKAAFDTLAMEEELVCEWEGLDPVSYPSFGGSADEYETSVRRFYAAWAGFATSKSYSWEDAYRSSEAPDRRARRMMERENNRFREEAIRDFNNAVRSLVAFVKKRDPRVKLPKKLSEEERQKNLRRAAAAQAARSRAANLAKYSQSKEISDLVPVETPSEGDFSDEKQEIVAQVECIVCKKTFKSENQYEAHEKSNKHIKAVNKIRRQMENEDKSFKLGDNQNNNLSPTSEGDTFPVVDESLPLKDDADKSEPSNKTAKHEGQQDDSIPLESGKPPDNPRPSIETTGPERQLDVSEFSTDKAINKSPSIGDEVGRSQSDHSQTSSLDHDYAPRQVVEERILNEVDTSSKTDPYTPDIDELTRSLASGSLAPHSDIEMQPKVGKAKEKRARKAAQQASVNAKSEMDVSRCS